jgi:4'-phosphopantetheinyl transferase EntD
MSNLRRLLAPDIEIVEASHEMWDAPLTAAESELVRNAVPRRSREFRAGRAAARVALQRLGISAWNLASDEHRRPLWPAGVVGSITHCQAYCAVAVARRHRYLGIGIDAEEATPLPPELLRVVCTERELEGLRARGDHAGLCAKLIFCAKEAFYKVYSPAVDRSLEFADVDVTLDLRSGSFAAECRAPHDGDASAFRHIVGTFAVEDGLVLATVAVEAGAQISG